MSFSVFAGMKTSSPNDGVLLCLRMFILLFYFVFVCYYFRILIVSFSPILSLGINGRFSNVYLEMVRIFKRSLVFLIMFFFLLFFFLFFFFLFFFLLLFFVFSFFSFFLFKSMVFVTVAQLASHFTNYAHMWTFLFVFVCLLLQTRVYLCDK